MYRLHGAFGRVVLAALCALSWAESARAIVVVPGNVSGQPVDLGSFAAGTYRIVGVGLVGLDGTNRFIMRPDGTPDVPVTVRGYEYFNPAGTSVVDGSYGQAGANAKIGALIGTLNSHAWMSPNPSSSQQSDWFQIGNGTTVSLTSRSHLYAAVNETYPWNNTGAFQVSVSAVPEPRTALLALSGLLVLGGLAGRRTVVLRTG